MNLTYSGSVCARRLESHSVGELAHGSFCLWARQVWKDMKSKWMTAILRVKELVKGRWEGWYLRLPLEEQGIHISMVPSTDVVSLSDSSTGQTWEKSWEFNPLLHSWFCAPENQLRQVLPIALPPGNRVYNSHARKKNASQRKAPACWHPHSGVWPGDGWSLTAFWRVSPAVKLWIGPPFCYVASSLLPSNEWTKSWEAEFHLCSNEKPATYKLDPFLLH